MRVEEDCLVPVQVLLAGDEQRGDVESAPEQLNVLHELLLLVLCVENPELRVHSLVAALEVDALLEHGDQLLEVAQTLVVGDQVHQVVHVHDDVHGAHLSEAELARDDLHEGGKQKERGTEQEM